MVDSKLLWIIRRSLRKVWARVVAFALFTVLTVGFAPVLGRFVPERISTSLGAVPVDQILTILASSMLAVTTFSLSMDHPSDEFRQNERHAGPRRGGRHAVARTAARESLPRWDPLHDPIPQDAIAIASTTTGYVQHIDIRALAECAGKISAEVYVAALPGSFVHPRAELVWLHGPAPGDDQVKTLRKSFTLGNERSSEQDPRFGLIVLSEIASRALSPAVNDPGTAISVIGRLVRVLAAWVERVAPAVEYPAVHVPPILLSSMLRDAFRPIARDGAAIVEVQMRLHKALDALSRIAPLAFGPTAAELSAFALERSTAAGINAGELRALEAVAIPMDHAAGPV
jgi:uncharacterized membrane protein